MSNNNLIWPNLFLTVLALVPKILILSFYSSLAARYQGYNQDYTSTEEPKNASSRNLKQKFILAL